MLRKLAYSDPIYYTHLSLFYALGGLSIVLDFLSAFYSILYLKKNPLAISILNILLANIIFCIIAIGITNFSTGKLIRALLVHFQQVQIFWFIFDVIACSFFPPSFKEYFGDFSENDIENLENKNENINETNKEKENEIANEFDPRNLTLDSIKERISGINLKKPTIIIMIILFLAPSYFTYSYFAIQAGYYYSTSEFTFPYKVNMINYTLFCYTSKYGTFINAGIGVVGIIFFFFKKLETSFDNPKFLLFSPLCLIISSFGLFKIIIWDEKSLFEENTIQRIYTACLMIQGVAYSVLSIFILNEKGLSQMPFVGKYFEKKEDEGNQGTEIQTSTSG
jgi:hypothetical protein